MCNVGMLLVTCSVEELRRYLNDSEDTVLIEDFISKLDVVRKYLQYQPRSTNSINICCSLMILVLSVCAHVREWVMVRQCSHHICVCTCEGVGDGKAVFSPRLCVHM